MKFWRSEFGPKCAGESFDKKYAYGVRYNYAKEGKRTDYTPYSCMKIIQTPVPKVCHHCEACCTPLVYKRSVQPDFMHEHSVQCNHAKEGERTDYTPSSCVKIIQTPMPKIYVLITVQSRRRCMHVGPSRRGF